MSDKVEIRFDERWAVGPRSKGGIAFIVDPVDGTVVLLGYKDGQVVASVETDLDEMEQVLDQGREAWDRLRTDEKVFFESEEGKAYTAKGKP